MSNVKLAIRVRPFTDRLSSAAYAVRTIRYISDEDTARELRSERDRTQVVNVVDDNAVTITNTKVSLSGAGDSRERIRRYYADYTFDSACAISLPSYASQEKVFESIGREVLESLERGCSTCVMAYGQSATGKTHTMIGTDSQPGLVPRLCRALADLSTAELTVSFLEIYNERVHDLLVEATPACHSLPRRRGNARKDLRVREHPTRGPYVQNLRRVAVNDVETLLSLVEEGTRRRRTAATRRNSTSSRSHALLDIVLPTGTLHLADLAGSEKASWEGCGGGRQKEGANINKSLVALSNVISALVSGGNGNRGRFVPYRDSALTWLLKDCFTGGGASTFIIATVSPSIACYGESASTLRWAERVRQLPTPKPTNSGVHVTSRAVLQTQLNQLIVELSRNFIQYIPETGKILYEDDHWKLPVNKNIIEDNTDGKIGSIMNRLQSKLDGNPDSTASSAASGSSDVINTIDKNLKIVEEINKEVDKLFVPNLERTSSSSDLKVVAPLRHKKRQYRSQEILPLEEVVTQKNSSISSLQSPSLVQGIEQSDKINVPRVPILHDSQRAEIVASVTERLYSKLKKKEEAAATKVESIVDRKIMEPLSELRICTNARQRLMELSQRAMRNKRRIGIPAYTQTRVSVIRVKDQGVDVQTDLESYIVKDHRPFTLHRDVGTETIPMTPRCKDTAVGSKYGTLNLRDRATITENKKVVYKNSSVMTDAMVKCEKCSQTPVVPPPRRKKRAMNLARYVTQDDEQSQEESSNSNPVININITTYPIDSESQSSDDNGPPVNDNIHIISKKVTPPPDLLSNHCEITNVKEKNPDPKTIRTINNVAVSQILDNVINTKEILGPVGRSEEFPESEEFTPLPRVSIDSIGTTDSGHIKNMILGRNSNIYPYNIVLSPPKERDTKRLVTFQDADRIQAMDMASQTDWIQNNDSAVKTIYDTLRVDIPTIDDAAMTDSILSESTNSSKVETDSFIWRRGTPIKTMSNLRKHYTPVYKSRYRTTQSRFYREFLGLDNNSDNGISGDKVSHTYSSSDNLSFNYDDEDKYRPKRANTVGRSTSLQSENVDRNILSSCKDLNVAVNDYERYLDDVKFQRKEDQKFFEARTPTEYMRHLVNLRREVVRAEGDSTE